MVETSTAQLAERGVGGGGGGSKVNVRRRGWKRRGWEGSGMAWDRKGEEEEAEEGREVK